MINDAFNQEVIIDGNGAAVSQQQESASDIIQNQEPQFISEQEQALSFLAYSNQLIEEANKKFIAEFKNTMKGWDSFLTKALEEKPAAQEQTAVDPESIDIDPENKLTVDDLRDIDQVRSYIGNQAGIFVYETPESKRRTAILSIENLPLNDVNEWLRFGNIKRQSRSIYISGTTRDNEQVKRDMFDASTRVLSYVIRRGGDDDIYCLTMMPYDDKMLKGLPLLKKEIPLEQQPEFMRKKLYKKVSVLPKFFERMARSEVAGVLYDSDLGHTLLVGAVASIQADKKRIYPVVDNSKKLKAIIVSAKFLYAREVIGKIPGESIRLESLISSPVSLCGSESLLDVTKVSKTHFADVGETYKLIVVPVNALEKLHFNKSEIARLSSKIENLPFIEDASQIAGAHRRKGKAGASDKADPPQLAISVG